MAPPENNSTTGAENSDENFFPDIMGQFPILDAYTQLGFGFELPLDVDRNAVIVALQAGLDKLIELIPWLGWQIGYTSGIRTAIPWPEEVVRKSLYVKFCDDTTEPMADLVLW